MMESDNGRMHPVLQSEELKRMAEEAASRKDVQMTRRLDGAQEHMRRGESVDAQTLEPIPPNAVLFKEGETIEIRGCWFRVDAVRRTRMTLTPIPAPR